MSIYLAILKHTIDGWVFLWIELCGLFFRWFTDNGEWFIYFGLKTRKCSRVVRLSGAGNYAEKFTKEG